MMFGCLTIVLAVLSVENAVLKLDFREDDGSFDVTDRRSGRVWRSCPDGGEAMAVAGAHADGKGVAFALKTSLCPAPLDVRIALDGERLTVSLDGDPSSRMASRYRSKPASIEYPYPFRSEHGDRILLPNGSGYSYPVEVRNLGDRYADVWTFYTRELKMGVWAQYRERTLASGEVVSADGYMAVLETPCNALGNHAVRSNGLRAFNVGWFEDMMTFGHARRIRFEFLTDAGPVAVAGRYREEMRRRGYLRTFAEKKRRHPEMTDAYDRLMRSPSVWYWAIDGEKAKFAKTLREEYGFGDFLFQFAARKDLGTWVTAGEVQACKAAVPGILLSEYDIYKDTMERRYLPEIDYVRPYWSIDAADNGDTVVDWDGTVARGWAVKLKHPVDGKDSIGCAAICEQRAPIYARRRVAQELRSKPYNARYFDVTGSTLWECHHPKHRHDRRESLGYRTELFRLLADEFRLLSASEDGVECFVPVLDYLTCGFSGPDYYRVDGGRWMWRIYETPMPEHVRIGLDPNYKIPFWEMVFHDCVVSYWDWCDYNLKWPKDSWRKDLWNAVSGTPPLYFFTPESWTQLKGVVRESYERATTVAKNVAGAHIVAYRVLTPDRQVQRSEWSNGVAATVNFGEESFVMPDGESLPPHGWRMESASQR